jgi:signal transduction histidine kinase
VTDPSQPGRPAEPIIVIDDDVAMRRACEAALKRVGYAVEVFADGPSGLARIQEAGTGLIVVDLKMPGMSGMEVIQRARQIDPDIVAIVITGYPTIDTAVEAMKTGAYDFLPKPFTAEEFRVIIARGEERRQLALEAKRLREERRVQARKFITFVSHQLQSPLGAVRQYLDVLRHQAGDSLPEQHRLWIDRSATKITEMLAIIGDWLTISKIEGGKLATERRPVHWQELTSEVLENHTSAADEQGVTLSGEVAAGCPPVIGDAAALRMLLSNLVVNAIKYNKPGGEVRIRSVANETEVRLAVCDTGIGLTPEQQTHVFDEFYRVSGAATSSSTGTGMGLAICKKIAEELGGRITVDSGPNEGSTFTVILPRAPAC